MKKQNVKRPQFCNIKKVEEFLQKDDIWFNVFV